jgi:hypothetical protein
MPAAGSSPLRNMLHQLHAAGSRELNNGIAVHCNGGHVLHQWQLHQVSLLCCQPYL